jgi:hypothetical protein
MDRIKAHRSAPTVYDPPTFDQMADRIKQLEESNKELTLQLLAVHGQAADVLDRAVVAEARLTKAVETLRRYVSTDKDVGNSADAVLAELEGKE